MSISIKLSNFCFFFLFIMTQKYLYSMDKHISQVNDSRPIPQRLINKKNRGEFKRLFKSSGTITRTTIPIINPQNIPAIEDLLKKGTNPNIKVIDKMTALHLACANGMPNLVSILLDHKARTNLMAKNKSALEMTCRYCVNQNKEDTTNRKKIIKMLCQHGESIHVQNIIFCCLYNRTLIAAIIKYKGYFPLDGSKVTHCSYTNTLIALEKLKIKTNKAPLALFYGNPYDRLANLPTDIITIIFNFYSALQRSEYYQKWNVPCEFVYQEKSDSALSFVPFMTEQELFKLYKAYYLHKQKQLILIDKKLKKTIKAKK